MYCYLLLVFRLQGIGGFHGAAQEDGAEGHGDDLCRQEGQPHQPQTPGLSQQPRHRQQNQQLAAHGDDQAVEGIADGLTHRAGDDGEARQREVE